MTLIIHSEDTVVALRQMHPFPLDLVLPPIFDYKPEHVFVLGKTLFTQALTTTAHLSLGGFYGMVYDHFLGCFIPKDPSLGFSKLFQIDVVVVYGDILRLMALVLGATKLLAMAKDTSGFRLITIGEVFL